MKTKIILLALAVNTVARLDGLAQPHPGFDKHEQKFRALRMMDEDGQIPPDGLWRALEHRRQAVRKVGPSRSGASVLASRLVGSLAPPQPSPPIAGIETNSWTWLGPGNIGGRVRSILIHPTLTNVLWCGSVSGGVWKSTNSGASWFPLDDFMANLAVACMFMDPNNADIIYVGTGEGFYNHDAIRGAGIFKTSDGGTTWTRLSSTTNSSFQYVSRLAIDPNNSQGILAATRSGIFRSTDAGGTWANRYAVETLDVAFHPTDSSQCIAGGYNGLARYSTNGGVNWRTASGLPGVGRVELSYSRSNPSTVFASVENSGGEIYRSLDGGHSYLLRNRGTNYLGQQGGYDNAIWADPTSTNTIIVGGRDLWRSTDAGATLTQISRRLITPKSAHADHHVIVSSPAFDGTNVKTAYFGNDGGVYRAADIYSVSPTSGWEDLNHNLGITQFYGGAGNSNTMVIIGGTQDNSTLRYTIGGGTGGWTTHGLWDGGFCAADQTDPNYFYGETPFLQIHRSINGGLSYDWIYSGVTEAGDYNINFTTPFILDPNSADTLLAGGTYLWRSTNVKAPTPSWSRIKSSVSSPISAIAAAPGNSDLIWVGHNNGYVYYTTNGTATNPTWLRRGSGSLPGRYCTRIAIAPTNSSHVYVTFGGFSFGNVWTTGDSGVTWTNISGNLPPAPMYSVVIAPWDPSTLYVGTEVGVYATADGGAHWSTSNDGPANVVVEELFWLGNKLVAVTYGRGMFYTTPFPSPVNLVGTGSSITGGNGNGSVDPNECNQLDLVAQNFGGDTARNVTATLMSDTSGVTIIQGLSSYPDLGPGAVRTNGTPFRISTSPSFVCGTPVVVTLNLSFTGGTNTATFTLPSAKNGYSVTQSMGASIVPGDTDIGNHSNGDIINTLIPRTTVSLPFNYAFYGQTFSNVTISPNGNLQFLSGHEVGGYGLCLPYSYFNSAIAAFLDDLRTDAPGSGIFTSVSGSMPNRIFNIEWRATYYFGDLPLNFEVRLYEGQTRFDVIYGELNGDGSTAAVGVQQDTGSAYTSFECYAGGLSPGLQLTFQLRPTCTDGGGSCAPPSGLPLILSPALSGAEFSFSFQTLPGKNYVVQFKDSLDDPSWQTLQTVPGDGNPKKITNPESAARQRFYRLRAE
jgi:photosystem II stability/assembly factor-like uncharacterized protein